MFTLVFEEEAFNNDTETFVTVELFRLKFEHSLVSLSKWEFMWEMPFMKTEDKTDEQVISYLECMLLDENPPEGWLDKLTREHMLTLNEYINKSGTATTFVDREQKGGSQGTFVTSELIYYWMVALQIPIDAENWFLNRLLTLVRVINEKNDDGKKKKMSRSEIMARNRQLNAERRAAMKSGG